MLLMLGSISTVSPVRRGVAVVRSRMFWQMAPAGSVLAGHLTSGTSNIFMRLTKHRIMDRINKRSRKDTA